MFFSFRSTILLIFLYKCARYWDQFATFVMFKFLDMYTWRVNLTGAIEVIRMDYLK